MQSIRKKKTIVAATVLLGLAIGTPVGFLAAFTGISTSMTDYTWTPAFLNQKVDPNVIILLDFGGAMLNAAYGNYPESRITTPACALNSSVTCPKSISSNVGGPAVTFSGGTSATGAAATATIGGGGVATIRLTASGSGYTSVPTVSFSPSTGCGGSGATATATIGGSVTAITVTAQGTGYTGSPPSVVISGGGGGGAAATATIDGSGHVTGVTVSAAGGGYTRAPTVTFNPNATGFATVTNGVVTGITLVTNGSGYSASPATQPTVTITAGGSGSGATATALLSASTNVVTSITVTNGGVGCNCTPTVVISGGGATTAATATATMSGHGSSQVLASITVTSGGVGYTSTPTISFTGGASGMAAVATIGTMPGSFAVTVTSGGSGYASNTLCNTNLGYGTGVAPVGCTYIGVIAGRDDQFDPNVTYYGMFNSLECLSTSSQNGGEFTPATPNNKAALSSTCPSSAPWDGNFLNWLGMRQLDLSRQVAYGGKTQGAGNHGVHSDNVNVLVTEPSTADAGTNATPDAFTGNTCNSTTCDYRYVKAAPAGSSGTRYPSTIPDQALFGVQSGSFFVCTCFVGGTTSTTYPSDVTAFAGTEYPLQYDVSNNAESVTGLMQNLPSTGVRTSIWFSNASSGQAASMLGGFDTSGGGCGSNASCMSQVRLQAIGAWSPLAESVYEALCYYRLVVSPPVTTGTAGQPCYQTTDFTAPSAAHSSTAGYAQAGDPFWFDANGQFVSCCKSFILLISAGKPTQDGNPPQQNGLTNFSEFQTTQPTDFIPTTSSVWPPPTTQTSAPGWLERIAYYGLTHDMRSDILNTQNVKLYTVVLNGPSGDPTGGYKMASASLWGGFQDQNNDTIPQMNGQTCTFPHTSDNKPATVLMPLTLAGYVAHPTDPTQWTSTSSPEWDADKDCVPDNYFEAGDAGGLTAAINNALAAIRKEAASGTSVSVLATSSTGEGTLYQAFFFPTQFEGANQIQWLGYTQGLWVDEFGNIRQDFSAAGCTGNPDARLVLEHDCIIKTRFDSSSGNVLVDVFVDADGNGQADSTTPTKTITLPTIQPVWEAGARLAYTNPGTSCTTAQAGTSSCRRILTWIDNTSGVRNNLVDSGEVIEFKADSTTVAKLCPYLALSHVVDCTSATASAQTAALNQATDIIKFHRGFDGTSSTDMNNPNLRNRTITTVNPDNPAAAGTQKIWKLGDVIDSTPTIVAAPKERFDTIYGDGTYATFFAQYKNRREIAYVGANDGMIHAFNGGFYTKGDDPSTTTIVEHGFVSTSPPSGSGITTTRSSPPLGAELWGFIPQELLPHLQWYASTNYAHTAYMDLKPKVTDVRIFCGDSTVAPNGSPSSCITGQAGSTSVGSVVHPGGWGTILIAGMRFGGSCGACPGGNGRPMTVNADFKGNGTTGDAGNTRTFYSSYYIFDITDPEQDPVLLWVITDAALGFTTSYPAVSRVSPLTNTSQTDSSGAKWVAIFGSGPTGYDARSTQTAKFYVVDLVAGPSYTSGAFSGSTYSTGDASSFMGDIISLDSNLDYRVDVIYAGDIICNSATVSPCSGGNPVWKGKMYRLTTGAARSGSPDPTNLAAWGLTSGGAQVPTVLLATFSCATPTCLATSTTTPVGPVTAGATVSLDNNSNIWVFFGTGRYFSTSGSPNDKGITTDLQYFFGVKDPVANSTGCTETTATNCQKNNLFDASSVVVCIVCSTGTNQVSGGGSATTVDDGSTSLQAAIQNMDGWFTNLPQISLTDGSVVTGPTAASGKTIATRERVLSTPTILGGTVFFTSFVPVNDLCASAGNGTLYALYYLTGSAYKTSTIGTSTSGGNTISSRSATLGLGLPSQLSVQIGGQGTGTAGSTSSSGCSSRVTGFYQASTGVLGQVCGTPALSVWSRMVSWRDL